jgi:hypothetical protein
MLEEKLNVGRTTISGSANYPKIGCLSLLKGTEIVWSIRQVTVKTKVMLSFEKRETPVGCG